LLGAAPRGGVDGAAGAGVEGERRAAWVGVEGERRAGGGGIKNERERERENKEEDTGFKYSIFGGRVRGPPKITLFSTVVSGAAENNTIFGSRVRVHQK
jgi:hypothetical protein